MPDERLSLDDLEKSICEDEFYEFFLAAWHILEPVEPLQNNWHIKYICDTLQAEVERIVRREEKDKDLLVNIPPRSLKSSIVTIMLNAWAWVKWPHLRFIGTSYSGSLAIEHAVKTRRIIKSPWYQKRWGRRFQLTEDQDTKGMFENDKGGFRKSVGVGGSLTGSGGDVLLCDDPINPEDAHSKATIDACIRWFKETFYSRLNNQKIGLRVVVMQRLHENDITGYVLREQSSWWRHICLPVTDAFRIVPEAVKKFYKGGLFFPDRFGPAEISKAQVFLGTYGFSGQMGQSPTPDGGGILKREWWKWYKVLPPKLRASFWSWDTAGKTGEENDYSVGLYWGVFDTGYYLIKAVRERMEYPDLKRAIVQHYLAHPSNGVLIEDKTSGQSVIQDIKRAHKMPIIAIEPIKDKITRAHLASPHIESGKFFLPEDAPWIADFTDECTNFPRGVHDDQVDALTQFVNYISSKQTITPSNFAVGGKLSSGKIF